MSERALAEQSQSDPNRAQDHDRLFRLTAWIVAAGTVSALPALVLLPIADTGLTFRQMGPVIGGFIFFELVALWLSRLGRREWAFWIFVTSLTATAFWIMFHTGGVTGPFSSVLIVVPAIAGLLEGRKRLQVVAAIIAVLYASAAVAESLGLLIPPQLPARMDRILHFAVSGLLLLALSLVLVAFHGLVQNATAISDRQSRELARASLVARDAAEAERVGRQRQETTLWQLRLVVQEYTAFLKRVSAGDYEVRLALGESGDEDRGILQELRILGDYLNGAVDALVRALRNAQIIQQRYVSESWADFVASRPSMASHSYPESGTPHKERVWRRTMAEAMRSKDATVQDAEAALPISVGGSVIGVIGARRDRGEWREQELELWRAAADQLGQTIENLRLLDQTRRAALREQTISAATNRMRESLEVADVLRTAASEIRRALNLEKTVVRLAAPESEDGAPE
jgi:GAF domain-containing protein